MDSVDSRQNHFARIQIDSPKGTRTSDPDKLIAITKYLLRKKNIGLDVVFISITENIILKLPNNSTRAIQLYKPI